MTDLNAPYLSEASACRNGRPFKVPTSAINLATAALVHTATSDPDSWDVVTIEACNINLTTNRLLAIQWGGDTTDDTVPITVLFQTNGVAIDRRRIRGGLPIKVWEAAASGDLRVHVQVETYKEPRKAQ